MKMTRFIFLSVLILMTVLAGSVSAETTNIIQVGNGAVAIANDGQCSLREAISNAANGDGAITDCAAGSAGSSVIMLAANGSYTFTPATANITLHVSSRSIKPS